MEKSLEIFMKFVRQLSQKKKQTFTLLIRE